MCGSSLADEIICMLFWKIQGVQNISLKVLSAHQNLVDIDLLTVIIRYGDQIGALVELLKFHFYHQCCFVYNNPYKCYRGQSIGNTSKHGSNIQMSASLAEL